MKFKNTILPIVALTVPVGLTGCKQDKSKDDSRRSNIVVIIADDLATHELSCYGGKNIETPNIDRLAREGMRFKIN